MVETGGTSLPLLRIALVLSISLAAAIFIGIVIYVAKARSKARADRAPASSPPSRADRIGLTGEGTGAPDEPSPLQPLNRPGEVMRVVRDQETGRILVEVEGQSYVHIREIADAQVGRRVLWAIADLIRFTEGMATNAQAVRSAAQSIAQEQGLPIPQDAEHIVGGQAGVGEATAAGLASPSTATEPDQEIGPRFSMSAFFQRGLRPPPASTPVSGPGSFVDEIETILQDMIAQRTTPLAQAVHVSVGPEDRLQIEVGSEVYGSADEVPDPEIQALIQAAVAEWETR